MADMEIAIGRFRRCYTHLGSYLQQRLMAVPSPSRCRARREAPSTVDIDIEAFVREHEASERRNGRVDKARTDSTHDDGPLVGERLGDDPPADDSSAASSATRAAAIRSPDEFLAADSALARAIPGFIARPQQVELATAIARTIAQRGQLIAEAGTGTGKTLAYLVPAHPLRQEGGDLHRHEDAAGPDHAARPATIRAALNAPVTVALLKGRANYICHHHLAQTSKEGRLESRTEVRWLREITHFQAALSSVPENAAIWSCRRRATTASAPTADTCRMFCDEGAARGVCSRLWSSSTITCSSPT